MATPPCPLETTLLYTITTPLVLHSKSIERWEHNCDYYGSVNPPTSLRGHHRLLRSGTTSGTQDRPNIKTTLHFPSQGRPVRPSHLPIPAPAQSKPHLNIVTSPMPTRRRPTAYNTALQLASQRQAHLGNAHPHPRRKRPHPEGCSRAAVQVPCGNWSLRVAYHSGVANELLS